MTAVPNCPTHQTPMRPGKKGGFYCPRRVGEGYCDQRIAAEKPQATPAQASVTDLVIVSYDIAARVLQGTACTVQELSTYAITVRNDIKAAQAQQ